MSLAVLKVDGIAPDRFARLEAAAEQGLGSALSGTSGTVTAKGVTVSYSYDGNELVFSVDHESWLSSKIESPEEVQNHLMAWVDSVK